MSEQLRILAPSGTLKLGLDALKLPTEFLNAGLTLDNTGSTLAVWVQIMASQDLQWAKWTNFYRGLIVDRREGRDWALFVPAAYITHRITHELWQNLPKDEDLEAYPGATYVPLPGKARFDVDVLLIYHLVEVDEIDLDITASAQPRVQLYLWVDLVNRLTAQLDFAGLVNPVGALSTLAVAIVDAFGIPARAFLYRLVGSAIVDAASDQPGLNVTSPRRAQCGWTGTSSCLGSPTSPSPASPTCSRTPTGSPSPGRSPSPRQRTPRSRCSASRHSPSTSRTSPAGPRPWR